MKRKLSGLDAKEEKLSQLLFNKTQNLVDKLNTEDNEDDNSDLKPAWIDDDDENLSANTKPDKLNKALYTEKLKQKYETLIGTPTWAKLNSKCKTEEDENDTILRTVGHLRKKTQTNLPNGLLELRRMPQINLATRVEGMIIRCVEFHPKISAALVAGKSGVVSLYSIGGDVNNKLHNFKLSRWNITAAHFTPDGSEALIASKHEHSYCVYNLAKAQPNLVVLPHVVKNAVIFQVSPDGKYIATSDGFEEIYLISVMSKELLKSFKQNSKITSVVFSHDSSQLYSFGAQGEIIVWDLSMYRPLKKFYDHGCVTATCLAASPCGKLLATGSGEGIVNIYQTENLTTTEPMPFKIIKNLTTKITNLKFNPSTEILSASSAYYPNAVKLVHIPSFHVFSNFPIQTSKLYQVDTVSFSPNSGYMGLGNNKGCASLYRLKYYKNY